MKKGFTLIELLVVVLIIGILAAVAVPQYQKAVLKSRAVQVLANVNALNKAQIAYHLANGAFTPDLNNLDITVENVSCGENISTGMVFCSGGRFSTYGNIEWHGLSTTGQTRYACYAKQDSDIENKLCQSYYQEWGGTQTGTTSDSHIYYYGKWN